MANTFDLEIVSVDGKKLTAEASIVNVKTSGGVLGIMAHHIPLVSIVEISHLNYKTSDGSFDVALNGGILNVNNNKVLVLAESFETKEEIDLERANSSKERAEKRISSKEDYVDLKRAEASLMRALNRIGVASK